MDNQKNASANFFEGVIESIRNFGKGYKNTYGILGIIAAVLVVIKVGIFYSLMHTLSNYILVCLVTLFFLFLIFKGFRNKWIPAVFFLVLSILMFADVTYSSFFGRYLSIGMIGAAGVVDDITESIKEVIRPVNFTMFIDCIVIFAALFAKKKESSTDSGDSEGASADGSDDSENLATRTARGKVKKDRKKRLIIPVVFILVLVLITVNPLGLSVATSVGNQEIFSFYAKDITGFITGNSNQEMSAYTDSYSVEKNGPLFGSCEGKNLIVIQIESLQNFTIGMEYNGHEVTPNLNAIINSNAAYFDNFYQQIGSGNTSDAEFATQNSIFGTITSFTYKLYNENYFRGLPVQLKERGYSTNVFHAYEDKTFWNRENMYPSEGFDRYYGGLLLRGGDYDMTEWMGWGLTDSEFFPQTVNYMKEIPQPFYNFVITISNHHPYEMLDHYKFFDLLPEDEGTLAGHYLQSAAYTDYSIGQFLGLLDQAGLLENSLIVMYGDHCGLTHNDETDEVMTRLLGHEYDYQDILNVPCIYYCPDESVNLKGVYHQAGGQLDTLPTIAYLMGFDKLDTIYVGHNLFNVKEGLVAQQAYMTKGSFFTNDIAFEMSRDGVFENGRAWNVHTGEPVDVDQCYANYLKSCEIVNTSEYVLNSDAIRKIFLEGGSAGDIERNSREYPEGYLHAGYPDTSLFGLNTEEALNRTYEEGYRHIMLDISWDEKSKPVAVNRYDGTITMTYNDIVAWMEEHEDAVIYFKADKSADYIVNLLTHTNSDFADNIVLVCNEASEYSGRYEGLLNLSTADMTLGEAKRFIKNNRIWAVVVDQEDYDAYSSLIEEGVTLYIDQKDIGIVSRAN